MRACVESVKVMGLGLGLVLSVNDCALSANAFDKNWEPVTMRREAVAEVWTMVELR